MDTHDSPRFSEGLLEPDTIVPSQYFDRVGIDISAQPEKRLMLAVLENAISTFQRHVHSQTRRSQRLVADVESWTAGAEGEDAFSFEEICAALNIEPDYLRSGMERWKERQLDRVRLGNRPLYRPPVRRVNGRRHKITGPREYYRKSA